jgi:hypothetical protein
MMGLRFEVFVSENAAVYLQAHVGREKLGSQGLWIAFIYSL